MATLLILLLSLLSQSAEPWTHQLDLEPMLRDAQTLQKLTIMYLTVTARRNFSHGFVQGLFARADARDRLTGEPTPEAPRVIWDFLGTIDRLPLHLVARGEYEQVGRKPLGDGFVAVPVREFRGALIRPFASKGIDVGVNFLIAYGYGGQTLETLALPGEGLPFERITGLPLKSYVTVSFTYHFRRR
jgi:hypothetical protein